MKNLAVYIHWPFCKFKCPYCDFNSHVRESVDHDAWTTSYIDELRYMREKTGDRLISSVFFGGGTPSLMQPDTAARVIAEIDKLWGLPQGTEVTLEANPTSVETDKLKNFKSAGVNRVSLGVQALRDQDLKKLGRQHSAAEAMQAVEKAAAVFDRYSFDLIYARPDQTVEDWRRELSEALTYAAGHMSLYQLTIEEGTQYHTLHQRGELIIPEEEIAAQMYELTQEMMSARGMSAYEISNHAKFGDESRHNLVYWRYDDYIGVGPGAHGRVTIDHEKYATRAHRAPEAWLDLVSKKGHGYHDFERIGFAERAREMIMMGLRLAEGLDLNRFYDETTMRFSEFVKEERVTMLGAEGLIDMDKNTIRATAAGRQKLNAVLSFLMT